LVPSDPKLSLNPTPACTAQSFAAGSPAVTPRLPAVLFENVGLTPWRPPACAPAGTSISQRPFAPPQRPPVSRLPFRIHVLPAHTRVTGARRATLADAPNATSCNNATEKTGHVTVPRRIRTPAAGHSTKRTRFRALQAHKKGTKMHSTTSPQALGFQPSARSPESGILSAFIRVHLRPMVFPGRRGRQEGKKIGSK
jgi:hypothetical protein